MSEAIDRCYAAALRILNYRFNSEAELRRKLVAKKFEGGDIEATIGRLRDENWLDDARFAGAFVRTRQAKRIGSRRIARELQAAGVDRDTARQALSDNSDPDREREDLATEYAKRRRLLVRRYGTGYLESAEGRKKLTAYLLKQGYDAALIATVVKETVEVDD